MTDTQICELFVRICERFGKEFGTPLPKRVLTLGDEMHGWFVKLNPTADDFDEHLAFSAIVLWNGFPASIVEPNGGIFAAGDAATEQTFREWLGGGDD